MKIKTMYVDTAMLDCIQEDSQKKEKTSTWCAECICLDSCFRDHKSLKEFKNKYKKILKKSWRHKQLVRKMSHQII